ncbi:hypothetical protein HXX76_005586 [Chlamydomonas incerta]|uniref:F-box domain-containing protein n=1 Tax=Chlamydomonas incerta TaxID=51695 RepID=A0A835T5U7_CHLIN|nr:hypothetical protein HXX76_005586 [Chlamydomonas incerta]|eukprot:KAG2437971.1 hypothetical protein HXX76_005586 [Chlamydomonas incerta]
MRTRQRAKAEAEAFTEVCWMPEEVQCRMVDAVLEDYRTPVLRNGLIANPARDLVSLMLVCRAWRDRVTSHPHTAAREASAVMLKVAWLTDAALLTGLSPCGQSKSTRLNRIPRSVRLLLHCGCRGCFGPAGAATAAGAGDGGGGGGEGGPAGGGSAGAASPYGRGVREAAAGRSAAPAAQGCASAAPAVAASAADGSTGATAHPPACACAGQGSTRWVEARILSRQGQRSEFERSSFPERVPLLALAAADVAPGELRGTVMDVMAALDGTYLCPFVVRLTFPSNGSSNVSNVNGSSGTGGSGDTGSGAAGSSASGSGSGAGRGAQAGASGGAAGSGGVEASTSDAAAAEIGQGDRMIGQEGSDAAIAAAAVGDGEESAQGTRLPKGTPCEGPVSARDDRCGAGAGSVGGQQALPLAPMRRLLRREDVETLACGTVAVGRDGTHLYLVPTAAALERTWVS